MVEERTQGQIDAGRREMARGIVEGQWQAGPLPTDAAKQFAEDWIVTAAQHAANEEYYRGERDTLYRLVIEVVAALDAAQAIGAGEKDFCGQDPRTAAFAKLRVAAHEAVALVEDDTVGPAVDDTGTHPDGSVCDD